MTQTELEMVIYQEQQELARKEHEEKLRKARRWEEGRMSFPLAAALKAAGLTS